MREAASGTPCDAFSESAAYCWAALGLSYCEANASTLAGNEMERVTQNAESMTVRRCVMAASTAVSIRVYNCEPLAAVISRSSNVDPRPGEQGGSTGVSRCTG